MSTARAVYVASANEEAEFMNQIAQHNSKWLRRDALGEIDFLMKSMQPRRRKEMLCRTYKLLVWWDRWMVSTWTSDHGGGGLSISKPHNHGTLLQHTLSYKQWFITRTQHVRTTTTGPCHVCIQVRIASTYVYKHVFLQLDRATYVL